MAQYDVVEVMKSGLRGRESEGKDEMDVKRGIKQYRYQQDVVERRVWGVTPMENECAG
jgi:hypothetical protein